MKSSNCDSEVEKEGDITGRDRKRSLLEEISLNRKEKENKEVKRKGGGGERVKKDKRKGKNGGGEVENKREKKEGKGERKK